MVLVARRGDLLSVLAAELIRRHGIEVHCFQADLADVGQRLQLAAALEEKSLVPDCLINNAGVGDYGTFADAEWTRVENMLRLNMDCLWLCSPWRWERFSSRCVCWVRLACSISIECEPENYSQTIGLV